MTLAMPAPRLRRLCHTLPALAAAALVVGMTALVGAARQPPKATAGADVEVRALAVERTSLASPASILAVAEAATTLRFNALVVDARVLGELCLNQGLEPRAAALASLPPSFDPLKEMLAVAHTRGLRVHARISLTSVASANDLPTARSHVVNAHPDWLMVPRPLARDLALLDPRSQLYLDRLLRWVRAQGPDGQMLHMSPVADESADALVAIVADVAARYPVDGIQLDDVAFPTPEFDYSRAALEAFKADALADLDEVARSAREQQVGGDLAAWPDAMPDRWKTFRMDRLTHLVDRIRRAVAARRPATPVSAVVVPDAGVAGRQHLQDWRAWVDRRSVDVICPASPTIDAAAFSAEMASARSAAGETPIWVRIGASQLSASETIERIRVARRLGASGIILASYDSLMSQPDGLDYLARVSRATFQR